MFEKIEPDSSALRALVDFNSMESDAFHFRMAFGAFYRFRHDD